MGSTPGKGTVISLSGVIWYVSPSQAAACDKTDDEQLIGERKLETSFRYETITDNKTATS